MQQDILKAQECGSSLETVLLQALSGRGADGSAPDWGSGGRLFKSDRSDHMGRRKVSTVLNSDVNCAGPGSITQTFHHYAVMAQWQSS